MLSKEQIDEFDAKYKRTAHVWGKGDPTPWEIVLRRPTRAEYKQFRSQAHNPAQKADAQEILTIKCAVYPTTRAEVDALLDEWPGIPEAASAAIVALCGMEAQEESK